LIGWPSVEKRIVELIIRGFPTLQQGCFRLCSVKLRLRVLERGQQQKGSAGALAICGNEAVGEGKLGGEETDPPDEIVHFDDWDISRGLGQGDLSAMEGKPARVSADHERRGRFSPVRFVPYVANQQFSAVRKIISDTVLSRAAAEDTHLACLRIVI